MVKLRRNPIRAPFWSSALLLLAGCSARMTKEPWVYGISRGFYSSVMQESRSSSSFGQDAGSDAAAAGIIVFLALPFAIDTVLLPITLPHDWIMVK